MPSHPRTLPILAVAAITAFPVSLAAEDALPGPAAFAAADTVVSLLTPRPDDEIQADIRAAQEVTLDAGRDRAAAELARADARARKEVAEDRADALDSEKNRLENLRDRAQDDAARDEFERQKRDVEWEKELEERRKRLFEADEELAEAERDLAQALERQAQADTELYRRELQLGMAGDIERPAVERRVLEAWKTAMERAEDVASRQKRVIERQITVLDRARQIREHGSER